MFTSFGAYSSDGAEPSAADLPLEIALWLFAEGALFASGMGASRGATPT